MNDSFNWKKFEADAIKRLKDGEKLEGADGVLAPMIKRLLEAALDGELQAHVQQNRPNRRNGKGKTKTVKTSHGPIEVETGRDREGDFDSPLLPKRSTTLGEGLDNKILALYGLGMSYGDIAAHLEEMYGLHVSPAALSTITDKVMDELAAWQARTLDPVYPFVWLDAIHFKVREEGRVRTKAVYTVLGLDMEGHKHLLGLYIGETESSKFWLSVLTDLQSRGVKDLLLVSIDNLTGFREAIGSVFPKADVQLCLVHQLRNSLRYVVTNDQKQVTKDLQRIYRSSNLAGAEKALADFEQTWGKRYPIIVRSWKDNWTELTRMFEHSGPIRRIIYTTNPVEGLHRQLRKVTKTKGAFTNDKALLKLLFVAYKRIREKWTMPPQKWGLTLQQLHLVYGDRLQMDQ